MYGSTRDRQKTSYNRLQNANDYPAIRGVPLVTQHHWRKILITLKTPPARVGKVNERYRLFSSTTAVKLLFR